MSKPYNFIPLLKTERFTAKGNLKGEIQVEIEPLTPIHLSQTYYGMNENQVLYKSFYSIGDNYAIPGTSIKGMVRNMAEMVSHGCINIKDKFKVPMGKQSACSKNENCIICDIFGKMGRGSKIKVHDFIGDSATMKTSIEGFPTLRGPKVTEEYLDNGKYKGYKIYNHGIESIVKKGTFNCECALKGSKFKGSILYEDLTEGQLKLLCFAIGLSGTFNHKIGYGKPAYYGSIKVTCKDERYVNYAKDYEAQAPEDIKKNIKLLKEIYSFSNAKRKADYDGVVY